MKDLRLLVKIKNNLILQTAEELWGKGLTQSAIAYKMQIDNGQLGRYLNFKSSPILRRNRHRRGEKAVDGTIDFYWTATAVRISEALNKNCEEIFPEHLRSTKQSAYQLEIESARLLERESWPRLDLDEHINQIELREEMKKTLTTLSPIEEEIIKMRFGIGEDSLTLKKVGEELNLTERMIRVYESKALRKLRHPSRARRLKEFV